MPTIDDLVLAVDTTYPDDPNDISRKLHQIDHDILRDLTRMAWAGVRSKTDSYTAVLVDAGWMIEVNSSSNRVITIPSFAAVAYMTGSVIGVCQIGTGSVTIGSTVADAVKSRGNALRLAGQYAEGMVRMRAANEWVLTGDLMV